MVATKRRIPLFILALVALGFVAATGSVKPHKTSAPVYTTSSTLVTKAVHDRSASLRGMAPQKATPLDAATAPVGMSEANERENASAAPQPGIPDAGAAEQTTFGSRAADHAGDQLRQRPQRRVDLGQQHRRRPRLDRGHAQLAVQGDVQDRRHAARPAQQQLDLRGRQRGPAGRARRATPPTARPTSSTTAAPSRCRSRAARTTRRRASRRRSWAATSSSRWRSPATPAPLPTHSSTATTRPRRSCAAPTTRRRRSPRRSTASARCRRSPRPPTATRSPTTAVRASPIVKGANDTPQGIQNALMGGNEVQTITFTNFNAANPGNIFRLKIGDKMTGPLGLRDRARRRHAGHQPERDRRDQRDLRLHGHGHGHRRLEHDRPGDHVLGHDRAQGRRRRSRSSSATARARRPRARRATARPRRAATGSPAGPRTSPSPRRTDNTLTFTAGVDVPTLGISSRHGHPDHAGRPGHPPAGHRGDGRHGGRHRLHGDVRGREDRLRRR